MQVGRLFVVQVDQQINQPTNRPTNQPTDQPTSRLIKLLGAAKNNNKKFNNLVELAGGGSGINKAYTVLLL